MDNEAIALMKDNEEYEKALASMKKINNIVEKEKDDDDEDEEEDDDYKPVYEEHSEDDDWATQDMDNEAIALMKDNEDFEKKQKSNGKIESDSEDDEEAEDDDELDEDMPMDDDEDESEEEQKLDGEEDDDEEEDEELSAADHQAQLKKLIKEDPEFAKFIEEEDKDLLEFGDDKEEEELEAEKKTVITAEKKFNAVLNSQIKHAYEIQNLKTKFDKFEEEYNRLKNKYEILNEKIKNSGAKTNILNGDNDFFHPDTTETSINNIQLSSNNFNVDEYNNFEAEVVNNTLTPVWIVEKSKCEKMLEKSQNQISSFLPLYLPEIYNSAELISPAYFPNATEKHQEINAIIKYFWNNQSSQDFYAKSIEKELQLQRYKVTRKMYHLLKAKDFCIMGKDGKVYDCLDKNRVKSVTLINDGIVEEWLIPNELIYDDYVIGAKKDEENKTIIYKLDLVSSLMKVIYTKRK